MTERLDAPVDLVWALVGDFSSLPRWDPLLKSFNATMTDGHLVRTARFDGWWIEERLDHRDNDAHQIDYEVVGGSRPEIIGATASIALTPIDKGATRIQWTSIAPDTKAGSTAPDADLAAYYHRRIGHLRAALGLAPKTTSSE